MEYDWRTRFGLPLDEVGRRVPWGEAHRLVGTLLRDPSSWTCAAVSGWEFPRSPEWLILADLFDAYTNANYKKPKAYPRPFPDPNAVRSGGTTLPRAQVISLLNRAGHHFTPEEED